MSCVKNNANVEENYPLFYSKITLLSLIMCTCIQYVSCFRIWSPVDWHRPSIVTPYSRLHNAVAARCLAVSQLQPPEPRGVWPVTFGASTCRQLRLGAMRGLRLLLRGWLGREEFPQHLHQHGCGGPRPLLSPVPGALHAGLYFRQDLAKALSGAIPGLG